MGETKLFTVATAVIYILAHLHSASAQKVCGMPADIALVLDSSASIYPPDFNKRLMPFLKDLVSTFEISPENVRFALLTYSEGVNNEFVFNFADYTDEASLLGRLDTVHFKRGESTRTDLGLKFAREVFFPTARPNVKQIEIIVTDGKATDKKRLLEEIAQTKKLGVTVFAVGVGPSVSVEELKSMATSMKYVFNVTSYAALDEIKDILAATACVQPTTIPMIQPCGVDPDIIFTMDSARMDSRDVRGVFDFITAVIREEGVDYEGMRVGLLTGECYNYNGFPLGEFMDKVSIGNYLDWLGQADVQPLVRELQSSAFTEGQGGRPGARRVGVVIIPPKVRDHSGIVLQATQAKANGIELFAVGLGKGNQKLLRSIASSQKHMLQFGDSSDLASFGSQFVKLLCESLTTEAPVVTPTPTPTPAPTPEPSTKKPGC